MKERVSLSTLQKLKNHKGILWTTGCQKIKNLNKMEKFLQRHKPLKLTQKGSENLNGALTRKEAELVMKKHPAK